jgi:hypothetical protein
MKTITIKVQYKLAKFSCIVYGEIVLDPSFIVVDRIELLMCNKKKRGLEFAYLAKLFDKGTIEAHRLLKLSQWSSTIRKTYP